jgi:hypothetical protein
MPVKLDPVSPQDRFSRGTVAGPPGVLARRSQNAQISPVDIESLKQNLRLQLNHRSTMPLLPTDRLPWFVGGLREA